MRPVIICANCGKEKPHHAKGLCGACYDRQLGRKIVICTNCGREGRHAAKELCWPCYNRLYYQENREEEITRARHWARENPEKKAAYLRSWKKENPERVADIFARRKARKKKVADTLTSEQLAFERRIGEAIYPGEKLHLHHLVPLGRGNHSWGNIMFIPALLNQGIGDRLPEEIYQQLALGAV